MTRSMIEEADSDLCTIEAEPERRKCSGCDLTLSDCGEPHEELGLCKHCAAQLRFYLTKQVRE